MRKTLALAALLATAPAHAAPSNVPKQQNQQQSQQQQQHVRHVDVVLALDTSSSMDGLIDGARQKLWDVVTALSKAKPQPVLRVGIISYGNTGYDAKGGWVMKDIDLTTDLDAVYGKLFGLRTNGGDEYVARAVKVATEDMAWSKDQDALRIVFVAGNEAANQDPVVAVADAFAEARKKNIFVNTIYCGMNGSPEANEWAAAAKLGKGQYAAIDQNQVVAIATPEDEELKKLSAELNKTYVAYGSTGAARAENQATQDRNAASASAPAAAARAVAKSSSLYANEEWDLVEASKKGKKNVAAMGDGELSDELRAVPKEKRPAYVAQKAAKREELQSRIAETSRKRDAFIQKARSERATGPALDDALVGGMRKEAEEQGFKF